MVAPIILGIAALGSLFLSGKKFLDDLSAHDKAERYYNQEARIAKLHASDIAATQRAMFAKAGLNLGTGSSADLIIQDTLSKGDQQAKNIKNQISDGPGYLSFQIDSLRYFNSLIGLGGNVSNAFA